MDQLRKEPSAAPAADDSGRQGKLSLKEIRTALGEGYKPIINVGEAAALSRLAVKTIQKKVSEGCFKQSVIARSRSWTRARG